MKKYYRYCNSEQPSADVVEVVENCEVCKND